MMIWRCQMQSPNSMQGLFSQLRRTNRLIQRLLEHRRTIRTADFNSSALAEHAWNMEHRVDWENVTVLSRQPDHTSRIVHESVFIRTTSNTLNRDSGALPLEYHNLFRKPSSTHSQLFPAPPAKFQHYCCHSQCVSIALRQQIYPWVIVFSI